MKKRVLVAMSGGVDSSVTAALLLKQGMDVEGVTLKLTSGLCCDIASAMAVCESLGIPHQVLDAQAEFAEDVVRDFISEYQQGHTPNPCIRCNDLIKFQLLLQHVLSKGFDFLATGHYARIEPDQSSFRFLLKTGLDAGKDQSYFLYRLSQEQMKHILFPLGSMHKADVRALAHELKLPAAERPESQEICFVPDNDYRAFLREHAPEMLVSGAIVLADGTIVGKHEGIALFTVGQRRKLGYSAGERLYVIRIEPETHNVVLGKKSELHSLMMIVSNVQFIPFQELSASMDVTVKIRYRSRSIPATAEPCGPSRIRVTFHEPVSGVSPGQAAVLYEGDMVIGGGIIER